MKEVTRYQSNDGKIWEDAMNAQKRDNQIELTKIAMKPLDTGSLDINNSNSRGYIIHKMENIRTTKKSLIELSKSNLPEGWLENSSVTPMDIHPSYFARFIDNDGPLSRAWSRMCCIDDEGKEYGQMFYAINPDKADGGCIADLTK